MKRFAVLVKRQGNWSLAGWDSTVEDAMFSSKTLQTEEDVSGVLVINPEGVFASGGHCCPVCEHGTG